jgi:dienelactone hydrolase
VIAACGDDGSTMPVTSTVVSDPTTQEILAFSPDEAGPWPVVLAMHGLDGGNQDMAELSRHVAEAGNLVFAPNWRTDITTLEGATNAARDAECAYRYSRAIATDYHGDLHAPMTFVGWSLGASLVLNQGLTEHVDAAGEPMGCFAEVARADVIIAISGCYYEYEGAKFDFDTSGFGNKDADITLVAGEQDTTCAAWQTEKAAAALKAAGYDVEVLILAGASHYAPIFHEHVNGQWVVVPGSPAGQKTVEIILDAIGARVTADQR